MHLFSTSTLLLMIGMVYCVPGKDHLASKNVENYDVGCYARWNSITGGSFLSIIKFLLSGGVLPDCGEGGLWKPVQCNGTRCYCVSVSSGKALPYQPSLNMSHGNLQELCLDEVKKLDIEKDGCTQALYTYPCDLTVTKYSYDVQTKSCQVSANPCAGFKSLNKCQMKCESSTIPIYVLNQVYVSVTLPKKTIEDLGLSFGTNFVTSSGYAVIRKNATSIRRLTPRLSQRQLQTYVYSSGEELLRRSGNPAVICRKNFVKGPCRARIPRWAFDSKRSTCRLFYYGGCAGNANNFETREECDSYCSVQPYINYPNSGQGVLFN